MFLGGLQIIGLMMLRANFCLKYFARCQGRWDTAKYEHLARTSNLAVAQALTSIDDNRIQIDLQIWFVASTVHSSFSHFRLKVNLNFWDMAMVGGFHTTSYNSRRNNSKRSSGDIDSLQHCRNTIIPSSVSTVLSIYCCAHRRVFPGTPQLCHRL